MADFRLVQPRGARVWTVMGAFALAGVLLWASAFFFGDATSPDDRPRVGAAADFGAVRGPVLPLEAIPFASLTPLMTRDLGRLVRLEGVVESPVAANSAWVRTPEGYRILARFEPAPDPQLLSGIGPGSSVSFHGYLQTIALAELSEIIDSLGVAIPRPPPARKFGDLPGPGFARVDSLYIKNYYVSVRPQGIRPESEPDAAT
ncbi:MAG: hypothetical protein GEU90_08550 [Gemmatimonas sp.]|nr:hypothetical protein [Gemmatimonas sp.]